jgi:molybdopterin-binding protein
VTAVVALRDVCRRQPGFTLEIPALDVARGEVLAVIGPNGSGKSTLLRVLGLLERPDAGTVLLEGRPVDAASALAERRRMATVFQESLLADTTVAANVALGLRFRGVTGGAAVSRVSRWLERLGVAGLAERGARTLSGGEAQRVALARALVLEPSVLLLDEPFASLDAPSRTALIADLEAILRRDRVTTVLVTHHRGEAQALADRVAVLIDGRLRQVDETARVFHSPSSEEVARFVGVETIVTGRVMDRVAGVCRVEVAGRVLQTSALAEAGTRVRLALRPEDVTLVPPCEPVGTSGARNVLPGSIARIGVTDTGVRVLVDCGFPVVATVTPRAADELGLVAGAAVLTMFKASALHVIPGAASLDTPTGPEL